MRRRPHREQGASSPKVAARVGSETRLGEKHRSSWLSWAPTGGWGRCRTMHAAARTRRSRTWNPRSERTQVRSSERGTINRTLPTPHRPPPLLLLTALVARAHNLHRSQTSRVVPFGRAAAEVWHARLAHGRWTPHPLSRPKLNIFIENINILKNTCGALLTLPPTSSH